MGDLSWGEMVGLASEQLGVSPRTLRRYRKEGLIANPGGAGHANLMTRQVAALARARLTTKSIVRLRHWLWWEADLAEWGRWRADRVPEIRQLARDFERWATLSEEERLDRSTDVAERLGKKRNFPPRRHFPRAEAVRGQVAETVMEMLSGQPLADLDAPVDPVSFRGRRSDVLDRGFGIPELRASGVAVPGEAGRLLAAMGPEVLTALSEGVRRFETMSEAEARAARDAVKAAERVNLYLGGIRLQEHPWLAAYHLVMAPELIRRFFLASQQ